MPVSKHDSDTCVGGMNCPECNPSGGDIRYFVYTVDGCSDYVTEAAAMDHVRVFLAPTSWRPGHAWVRVVKKQSDGSVYQPVESVTYRRTGRGNEIEGTRP